MFCTLEKDEKTYRYLQMVIAYIREDRVESLQKMDNMLQTRIELSTAELQRLLNVIANLTQSMLAGQKP